MTSDCTLPQEFITSISTIGALQSEDGSVPVADRPRARRLAAKIGAHAARLARFFGQPAYAEALAADFAAWAKANCAQAPDFSCSRDALRPPENGKPFFFSGPLRLANGGRGGWRIECFLALREEPGSADYKALYRMFPHPKNICQSSHLIAGSQGLMTGNNIVFFPENVQAASPLAGQAYAVFFFNKFYDIYNGITLPKVAEATEGMMISNPTGGDLRRTYLARCVWGYLHDYFHHRGPRPFDQNIAIKTRWFTGLLEEIKVDLETWLVCRDRTFVDAEAVAEFILFDRAFRYPSEPDWQRNFDSGTGLLLLSLLAENGGLSIKGDGRVKVDMARFSQIAEDFVTAVRDIETLPDEEYLAAANKMVRQYLPEGPNGERIGLPVGLARTRIGRMVGSAGPITFKAKRLCASIRPDNA